MLRTLAALTLLTTLASAQTPAKRPMTFADLQAMHRISDPQISPSGMWVLFSVADVDLAKNTKVNHLWIVPLDGSKPERQLTSNTGESNGRFSPNGQFVMYTGEPTKNDPISRITIATWDDATGTIGTGRTLQAVSGDADGAIWSPDSKHFLFTTQVYPECSDKPTWTEEDACDKSKDDAAEKSPVKAQIFTHLLYRHWNAYTGEKRTHIIEADFSMDGANPRDLTPRSAVGDAETPTFSLGGPLGYAWAPDSREIAYETNLEVGFATPTSAMQPGESTNNDIFTLRLDEPNAKAKKVSASPGSDDGPQYSPDGKWLAWRSQARNGYESDKFDLVLMDRHTGQIKDLTSAFDGWVDEFAWYPGSSGILFVHPEGGLESLYGVDLDTGHIGRLTAAAQMTDPTGKYSEAGDGELGQVQFVPNQLRVVAVRMKVSAPAEIVTILTGPYSGPPHSQIEKILTTLNTPLLNQLDLPKMESFWFPGANGTQVEGFIINPPNFDPTKKYPLKFLIHGGPQGAWGDAWSYRWNPELFAANGYVVVMINPRGSTGYGQKFLEQVSGDWGGRPYIDLMKGLDYAEAKYPFIDKTRECALGASYGGFMADWVLTHTNRFACIVTHDGMYNPQSAFGTTEELWFNEWEFRQLAPSLSSRSAAEGSASSDSGKNANAVVEQTKPAHPWDFYNLPSSEDPFRKWSPMYFIKNAKTPTLIIHSQRDYRLDVSEGLQLFTALQLLHVPSKMLYFPDEGHWVQKPQNSQLWYQTVNDWVDQWTHTNNYAK
jgi:dipeptidyl aminopeptidase/acylaminoacyl peptidase